LFKVIIIMKPTKNQNYSTLDLSNCIRILSADAVEKAKSGHPGMPLGMADFMTILAFEFLKFNPNDPKWFDRDRLVLSAGHGSMLLYSFYYLAGYKHFPLEEIKNFRQLHSKASGHPEYGEYEAIETTSGPLGQGLANAVGMAIAEKKYKEKLGLAISDHKIYAIMGDGCLMEGIAYESASLAGHLKLDNLVIIFDNNSISIDGKTDLAVSEDHLAKFAALGFETEAIDGHDPEQIRKALKRVKNTTKPFFISCKTTIGKGTKEKFDTEKVHGSPLGKEEIEYIKQSMSFPPEPFAIPAELKSQWEEAWQFNSAEYEDWQARFNKLSPKDKDYLSQLPIILSKEMEVPSAPEATRVSSGKIVESLMRDNEKIICGSADLSTSNNLKNPYGKAIKAGDFSGNFIHYGVREHAMAGIMNGLSLSGFFPIGGTFFVFSDYMRPSIRLAAMMRLPMIYVMTHDSIGVGEDGPTHQPIEHLASFRSMPNLNLYRPADFIETMECYELAIKRQDGPSMIVLSRQNLEQLRSASDFQENLSAKGGYVISDYSGATLGHSPATLGHSATTLGHSPATLRHSRARRGNPENMLMDPLLSSGMTSFDEITSKPITIFASGSEVGIAKKVQEILQKEDYSVRVVSVPCFVSLVSRGKDYIETLAGGPDVLCVAIEAGASFGWHQIIGRGGLFFGIDQFGLSAPSSDLYEYFGLTPEKIASRIRLGV